MALPLEVKKLNYLAILTLIALLIYFSGSLYALITTQINFKEFLAAVGTPTGLLIGYLARDMQVTQTPQ